MGFCCPVCMLPLTRDGRTLRCKNGHCYDLARQNYVNLLRSNQPSEKRHGDDRLMVEARQQFLDSGLYAPLQKAVCALAVELCAPGVTMLDVGCGEGYYTSAVRRALDAAGKPCTALGVDISKAALCAAHRRDSDLQLAVASVSRLPVADESCELLLNIFAPQDDREFARVLKPGGIYLKVVPDVYHLWELKQAVYDTPYPNDVPNYAPEGFSLLRRMSVTDTVTVAPQAQIENLFSMTPYYYKTSRADQEKLKKLDTLRTQLAFVLYAFRRVP